MSSVVIVGSGASGVHFALSVLRKGYEVTMLDVGFRGPEQPNPADSLNELKTKLADPVAYFLGHHYESVVRPGSKGEYYGFPPTKSFVFSQPTSFELEASGFAPLVSFSEGGLAEVWTGGVYPLNDEELTAFPFGYSDLERYYSEVAERIGISGTKDDLVRAFPVHENLGQPLRLDELSQELLGRYEKHKRSLNDELRCYLGRSRVATLESDMGDRKGCTYLGRCLWGCPTGSLYTPSITLNQCRTFSNFHYVPNMYVSHFEFNSENHIVSMVAESLADNTFHEFKAKKFVLAAGTLSSSKIYLDSIWRSRHEAVQLQGLMDNRQILIPFVSMSRIGKSYDPENYQYHQVALGIESQDSQEYIHGQITTLKTALVHPIIQNLPVDLRTAISLFKNVRAGLGVVNLNLHDRRRDGNFVALSVTAGEERSKLVVHYSPAAGERRIIRTTLRTVKKLLWKLGCLVPPGMTHVRPMGASVHYAGTIPMSAEPRPHTSSAYGQSHDFENLFFVDGTTFPFLPAKNLTFTLMANAVRVADTAF